MYINGTNRTKSQRQAELKKWGFWCSCPACENTLQGQKREEKMAELFALDQALAVHAFSVTAKSLEEAHLKAQKMVSIQNSDGLVHRELRVT